MYRAPSLACACAIAARTAVGCSPSANSAGATEKASSKAELAEQEVHGGEEHSVDVHDAVYLLNPSGDLASTQSTFQQLFQQQEGWQVRLATTALPFPVQYTQLAHQRPSANR